MVVDQNSKAHNKPLVDIPQLISHECEFHVIKQNITALFYLLNYIDLYNTKLTGLFPISDLTIWKISKEC